MTKQTLTAKRQRPDIEEIEAWLKEHDSIRWHNKSYHAEQARQGQRIIKSLIAYIKEPKLSG